MVYTKNYLLLKKQFDKLLKISFFTLVQHYLLKKENNKYKDKIWLIFINNSFFKKYQLEY